MVNVGSTGRLVWPTSSMMPTVKPFFGSGFASSSNTAFGHRRGEVLRRQPVAAADDPRHRCALAAGHGRGERRHHVEIERLARGAGLLGLLEHRDRANGLRQRGEEGLGGERAVQPHLQHADLLARARTARPRSRARSRRPSPSARSPARRPAGRHSRTDGTAVRSARRSGPSPPARCRACARRTD